MAFLDNSGDIILDAVLTEVGRKRLTQTTINGGTSANITHFALGDDEINYSQYDLNAASGSNYADLEILQTPILQAFTMGNANINYGLMSLTKTDILYLPSLKVNSLTGGNFKPLNTFNNIFYFAVNAKTYATLKDTEANIGINQIGYAYNAGASPFVFIEGGLNTPLLQKDASNKASYIEAGNISNRGYTIGMDNRLGVPYTSNGAGTFANNKTDGTDMRGGFAVSQKSPLGSTTSATGIKNYSFYQSAAVNNGIVQPDINGPASILSAIEGPGDTVTCFKVVAKPSLRTDGTAGGVRDVLYSQIGSLNKTAASLGLSGDVSRTYDIIDTMIYINGSNTGGTLTLPVRIIRQTA